MLIKKSTPAKFLVAAMLISPVSFAQQVELDTADKKYSYAIGTKIAGQLLEQFNQGDSGIDMKALAAGVSDVVNGSAVLMNEEEASAAIAEKQQEMLAEAAAAAGDAMARGEEFREQNRSKEGVTETASGIQYTVLTSGDATGEMPTEKDTVVVHYRGTLIDGTEFDSSYSRGVPATFPLNGVIPGWVEALQLMRAGDKWNVVIPPELAYGERGAGGAIGPNETLIFEVELIEIKKG